MATQRILIVGAGAVGQVLGGHLHHAGHQVLFLARQSQVDGLLERGIHLRGSKPPLRATGLKASSELFLFDTFDHVFICVRAHQWPGALDILRRRPDLSPSFVWCFPIWWFEPELITTLPGMHSLLLPGFGALPREGGDLDVRMRRSTLCSLEPAASGPVEEIAGLLTDHGIPTRIDPRLPARLSWILANLFPLLAGLETESFSVSKFLSSRERWQAVTAAQTEAMHLLRAGGCPSGSRSRTWQRLPNRVRGCLQRSLLRMTRGFHRDLFEIHFRKTDCQQTDLLRRLVGAPFAGTVSTPILKQLIEQAEATRVEDRSG